MVLIKLKRSNNNKSAHKLVKTKNGGTQELFHRHYIQNYYEKKMLNNYKSADKSFKTKKRGTKKLFHRNYIENDNEVKEVK